MNARTHRMAAGAAALVILLGSASCGDVVRQGRSPSFLVVDLLVAAAGATPGNVGGTLQSDVVTNVPATIGGVEVQVPTIYEDFAQVTLRILLKDLGAPGAGQTPSTMNAVTVNRYRVAYRRSDGRNVQGVDVPYAFDGALTATITASPLQLSFTLVRVQAKIESPLRALVGAGGAIAISTIADVTFYGHDLAGNDVSETASISVNFSDWGDPQ